MCPFFPKSLWRKKGRKNPHLSGLARFKYQPLLAFHWCSAAFARLLWEPLQHTNLQSADTYAVKLKVFFVYQEPFRASLCFLHWFRLLSELSLAFHQSSAAEMRHCLLLDTKFILQMSLLHGDMKYFTTFIITVSKNYCKKTCHYI